MRRLGRFTPKSSPEPSARALVKLYPVCERCAGRRQPQTPLRARDSLNATYDSSLFRAPVTGSSLKAYPAPADILCTGAKGGRSRLMASKAQIQTVKADFLDPSLYDDVGLSGVPRLSRGTVLAALSRAFDLAEGRRPGHAQRVAYIGVFLAG